MLYFTALVYLSGFHHTRCGPWPLATFCSWRVTRMAISQYLLIIHLSSEHLRGHPVGGANHSQRFLVFFLTAEREEEGGKLHVKPALMWAGKTSEIHLTTPKFNRTLKDIVIFNSADVPLKNITAWSKNRASLRAYDCMTSWLTEHFNNQLLNQARIVNIACSCLNVKVFYLLLVCILLNWISDKIRQLKFSLFFWHFIDQTQLSKANKGPD